MLQAQQPAPAITNQWRNATLSFTFSLPFGWKLSNQSPSSFCTLSGNGSQLVLKFKLPPAVFNKEILHDMSADLGKKKPTEIWQWKFCTLLLWQL
jgi:hypothetical protein